MKGNCFRNGGDLATPAGGSPGFCHEDQGISVEYRKRDAGIGTGEGKLPDTN